MLSCSHCSWPTVLKASLTWTSFCSKPKGYRTGRRHVLGCCLLKFSEDFHEAGALCRYLSSWFPEEERRRRRRNTRLKGKIGHVLQWLFILLEESMETFSTPSTAELTAAKKTPLLASKLKEFTTSLKQYKIQLSHSDQFVFIPSSMIGKTEHSCSTPLRSSSFLHFCSSKI